MLPPTMARVVDVFVRARNGQPMPGATITFSLNGSPPGLVENAEGRGRIELPIRQVQLLVSATYDGDTQKVDLAVNQDTFTFTFDVNVGKASMDFVERHVALV